MRTHVDYNKNVFINCPFDDDYYEIFNAILFVTHRCGFILRCSKEYDDSSGIRIKNIIELISQSKYSIHDLSRVTLDETAKLPRFNMPLELGICIGALEFGNKKQKENQYLVIESEKFRFKQFISDISGQDIKDHNNNSNDAIKIVRNWLSNKTSEKIPSASKIISEYERFISDLPELCKENQWIQEELTFAEYSSLVTSWLTLK
jgi:intergrase/recombinase